MKDGIIELSKNNNFGFTPDLFEGYLWKSGDSIYISFIVSKYPNKGNFKKLIQNILSCGYTVKVPTPLGRMMRILIKNDYIMTIEGACAVWILKPNKDKK